MRHFTTNRPSPMLVTVLIAALFFPGSPKTAAALQNIELPITIDYPLLRSLLVHKAFPGQGESTTLINEGNGCIYLALSQPRVSRAEDTLKLQMQVTAHGGTPLGGSCYTPLQWQGYLVLFEKPRISAETWQLSFTTVDSRLLGADGQPAQITDVLWQLIKPHIWSYIDGIRLDLAPPVSDLKNFLFPLFPREHRQATQKMVDSMRPGQITVGDRALRLAIHAEAEQLATPRQQQQRQLSEKELEQTVAAWENWDGLLVYLLSTLSAQTLNDAEKRTLTTLLLDTRYRFVNELGDRTMSSDIVREQFVTAWKQVEPIFRRHLLQGETIATNLGYLAFIASADALLIFDRLGPTFGIEISTEGLVRLARMLRATPQLLQYRHSINPDLRRLFEFGPHDQEPPAGKTQEDSGSLLRKLLTPLTANEAMAASSVPGFQEILRWKVPKTDVQPYLQRVGKVLAAAASKVIAEGKVPKQAQKMYHHLIPAMAWQESCLRQFVVKGDQLTYLLSYNNSSVGLMQVNERVWRGLYSKELLRWNIEYNAKAGSEIAALYLKKYIFRDEVKAAKLDDNTLARLVYALYNGGPSQHGKFLKRMQTRTFYDSDTLFWQKYQWVTSGQISKVSICLTGR